MYKDRRILAVVPARGGSKGIALKNLAPVGGLPMVARVGGIVAELAMIDCAVVSTDHAEIAEVAKASGLDAPFMRPEALSGDRIGDWQVLSHALGECERIDGGIYDIIVMLQPTSPLRLARHVEDTIAMLVDGGWDAVWTVSESDSKNHPLKQLRVRDGALNLYDPAGRGIIARQQLTTLYHRNGAAYAFTRQCLVEQKTISGARSGALVIDEPMVSIDTAFDIELVEFLMARRDKAKPPA